MTAFQRPPPVWRPCSCRFPHAVDDHQTTNVKFLSKQGAALLVQQNALTAEGLAQTLASLSRSQLKDMARAGARPGQT